jgi:hypothetical protein
MKIPFSTEVGKTVARLNFYTMSENKIDYSINSLKSIIKRF